MVQLSTKLNNLRGFCTPKLILYAMYIIQPTSKEVGVSIGHVRWHEYWRGIMGSKRGQISQREQDDDGNEKADVIPPEE